MSRARAVVEVVAKALAEVPDEVRISESSHRGASRLELFTAPGDLGRLIGRRGRTAAAVRELASAAAESEGQQVTVEFRDGPPDDEQ
ncbi:MAG: KH domain-containing protein [Vicinamibacterales bacterium]|nr:KH domain-containing protein [Vicinamibacterales bacterium]MDP7471497.1 KH domain-containing protein [Vicinamibacterales bacterium]MDP7671394.1 KH domain-containing protein [Vicinamibacterales bacterium]HJO39263.1 KH domain-containing protein [Vicinamibacterales bacterium]